jgi:hypothetical protein
MLRADYPKPLLERKIVLADGVFAAFECKLRLYTEHFVSVLEKAKSVKELASKAYMHDAFHHLHGKFPYVLLAHSHEWDRPNSKPYENFISQVVDSVPSVAGHPAFALDFACIADLATYAAKPLPFLAGERKVLSDPGAFVTTLLTGSTYNPIGLLIIELNRRLGSLGLVDPWLSTTIMRTTEVGSVMEVHKNHRWPTSAFPPDLINKMRANQLNSVFRAGAAYIKMHPDWSPFPEGG